MAKLGFKDIIMKYLKKDEEFKLKYVDPLNKKNFHISYRSKGEAEAKMAQLKRDGVKDIQITQEDAPANATGTAVAGTGDDSSTVVVKKKKELQKKLMTRMGITETIDRTIPDLEYPKDEIRERADQLKELALKEGAVQKAIMIAKKMGGNMTAAVREIEKIAKGLSDEPSVRAALRTANESLEEKRVAQDKDVKSKPGTQPKKYYKTLSKSEKEKRAAHFAKQKYRKSDDDDDYKPAPGDKGAKTKPSKFTKKFKQMYGEVNQIDEKIKGLENKAKKSGMPYGILKKVYDRGMAAWKGGHRPGTTQQQWAFARVNSFVTKSPGTWGKADSDLAKKVRAK